VISEEINSRRKPTDPIQEWAELPGRNFQMMAKISELAPLAQKLNEKTDQINSTISTLNEKLGKLNLGIEVWLDSGEPYPHEPLESEAWSDEGSIRSRSLSYLGYCRLGDKWQLAVKDVVEEHTIVEGEDCYEEVNPGYTSLLQASRSLRLAALEKIPRLLDKLKKMGQDVLNTVEAAEKFAEEL
jgi:hypothetical protein